MPIWLVIILCTASLLAGVVVGWGLKTSFSKRQQARGY